MKLEEIKEIIDIMDANGLSEFELEEDGVRISLKKGVTAPVVQAVVQPQPPPAGAAPVAPDTAPAPDNANCVVIKAPFVGTFYRASAPDADPYVIIGQEVGPETVLCVVEAMKVMNEIKAEVRGVIREIQVENAHAVQYGQPLFKIEKL